jgi:FixJ family two-component response regulator
VGLHALLYASAVEFLASARDNAPSCLVLDVRLPGLSGLELQRQLSESGVQIPIIFVTGHGDVPMSVKAMKAGALEFLPKPFRDQDLLDAIQVAMERDRARLAREQETSVLRARFASLTPREREVMAWVISGRLNKQIAAELGTSEITVKTHRAHLMRKMMVDSVAQLVRMASEIGIGARK